MDYGRENRFSRNTFQVISGARGSGDLWDIDYDGRVWKRDASVDMNPNSRYNGRETQTREPPNKESKSCQFDDMTTSNRSTGIGKMLFKTKLCCKFRAGSCPYINNCNFAHSIEELRKPPPNWQEIVSAREEGRRQSSEPREEFQIPSLGSSDFGGESQRSYKGRHCKRFYSDEGCPYGDACTFLHDEQSKARESVAISLGPGSSGGYGGSGNESNLKPSNWKTRICNKWEETGYCPFGSKCYFAHGAADLLHYTGGMVDNEAKDSSAHLDSKQRVLPSKTADVKAAPVPSIHHSEGGYLIGAQPQKLNVIQKTGARPHPKWKGPDKISKIYGDWLDDIE